jgi:hypothetical protein
VFDTSSIVANLTKLKTEKFSRIKIPYFDFSYNSQEVIIESEYIKGNYPLLGHMRDIKQSLVHRKSDWSFTDYNPTNFKIHRFTEEIYAVDLDDFMIVDVDTRLASWEKFYQMELYKAKSNR